MIDRRRTIESILDALEEIDKDHQREMELKIIFQNGRILKRVLKVPDPAVDIALRMIKGEKED